MKKYDVTIIAHCPEEKRSLWEDQRKDGYLVVFDADTVRLVGHTKTRDDLAKIDHLVWAFPDHHIIVKEIKNLESSSDDGL